MLDGVYCDPIVQDSFQESVFAEFTGQLYRYRPAADDLAYLAGVGMAAPPGEKVTDDDQVRRRGTRRAFACRHRRQHIGGVGLEAFALPAVLVDGSPGALGGQLEAVDERHTGLGWESTCKADHPEAVAPMAEVPCLQLLAMEVGDIGVGLAVLAGFVAELPEVRVPCELEQLGFSTWRLGLGPSYFGRLAQGQFAPQEG
jgi:hypothetical protein